MTGPAPAAFEILLVEDNDFDARRVSRALSRLDRGYRLHRATDGRDALAQLRRGAPATATDAIPTAMGPSVSRPPQSSISGSPIAASPISATPMAATPIAESPTIASPIAALPIAAAVPRSTVRATAPTATEAAPTPAPPADVPLADVSEADVPRADVPEAEVPLTAPLQRPCIILLDLNMPVMGGVPFLQELRRDPKLSGAPVVVMTTSAYYRDVEAAHALNVAGYVVKPMSGADLTEALHRIIGFFECCVLPD